MKIGCTWIGKANHIAHRDYDREINSDDNVIYWDDCRYNKLQKGDYFAFVDAREQERKIVFRQITDVKPPADRKTLWSNRGYIPDIDYKTNHRNCLIIDREIIFQMDWNEYRNLVGYTATYLRGTQYIRNIKFTSKE
jgi:hypothetical protein